MKYEHVLELQRLTLNRKPYTLNGWLLLYANRPSR